MTRCYSAVSRYGFPCMHSKQRAERSGRGMAQAAGSTQPCPSLMLYTAPHVKQKPALGWSIYVLPQSVFKSTKGRPYCSPGLGESFKDISLPENLPLWMSAPHVSYDLHVYLSGPALFRSGCMTYSGRTCQHLFWHLCIFFFFGLVDPILDRPHP